MKLSLIVAMSRNGVIGKDGGLPWGRMPEDLRLFRELTMGKAVVVGRKTWEELPRLTGRRVVLLTRTMHMAAPGPTAHCWDVLKSPREVARELKNMPDEAFVIGGARTYAAFRDHYTEAHVTLVDRDCEGDTVFPFPLLGSPDWSPLQPPRELREGVTYHRLGRA